MCFQTKFLFAEDPVTSASLKTSTCGEADNELSKECGKFKL